MKAFIACLSTDNYIEGVLTLYKSLMATKPATKYPFYCLVSRTISEETIKTLEAHSINVIAADAIDVSGTTNRQMTGWDYTYFKFRIFELTQFEKLVYLDSDMIVMKNLDELFDMEPIAICKDGYQFTGVKDAPNPGCNSGLMVIKPSIELFNKLVAALPDALRAGISGDQAILNNFLENPTWLPEIYNMTPNMIDKACYRTNYYNFKYKDIKVIHFIWKFKPFMQNQLAPKNYLKLLLHGHFHEIKSLRYYYKIMKNH